MVVSGLDFLSQVSLLQTIPVLHPYPSEFVPQNGLLKNPMFRKTVTGWKVSVRIGVNKRISGCEHQILVRTEIDSRSEQELLPLRDDVVPPPLSFEMDAPPLADRMVSKIVVPAMGVYC